MPSCKRHKKKIALTSVSLNFFVFLCVCLRTFYQWIDFFIRSSKIQTTFTGFVSILCRDLFAFCSFFASNYESRVKIKNKKKKRNRNSIFTWSGFEIFFFCRLLLVIFFYHLLKIHLWKIPAIMNETGKNWIQFYVLFELTANGINLFSIINEIPKFFNIFF